MYDIKQRIDDLAEKYAEFLNSVNLNGKKEDYGKLEGESTDPSLWNDQEKAKNTLRRFADLKKEIEEIESLGDEINTLKELCTMEDLSEELEKEVLKAEKTFQKLTLSSFLSGKYDKNNAIVSIHAGQGGTEAMDWTSMLLRMYLKYCENKGWETSVIDMTSGEEAGIKSVTFKVVGNYAYGYLKGEAGAHRLVRQSPFNADKLRQTSFSLVEVLPEIEDVDTDTILKEEDIEVQFFHSSSQGGQNVQKVSTAVRLTHKPTGIVVTAQAERFQEQNRKNAMNLLRAKLWALEQEKALAEKRAIKGEYRPAGWGTQIRSYVLHPYKMVKDLRTEAETSNTEAVLDGDLDMFVEAELQLN